MTLAIIINQSGASAGVAGQAREDLVTGVPVTASLTGGPYAAYLWSLTDKPVQYTGSPALSSAAPITPLASSTSIQPIDNPGTYLVQVLVDSGQGLGATPADVATITFYAGPVLNTDPTLLPRRVPAFGERLQHNVPDPLFSLFGGLNLRGWAQEGGRWFENIKRLNRIAAAFARVSLPSGGPATVVQSSGIATVTRTGVGLVSVTFASPPPVTSANYGVVGSARGSTGGSITAFSETTSGFMVARSDPFGTMFDGDFSFSVVGT
jgi:hypothetical protein